MKKIIGIPSNGPELTDKVSQHFGHCKYFVGVEIHNDDFKKAFSLQNSSHSGCMEHVITLRERNVSEMIIIGIGARPFTRILQEGIKIYNGVNGSIKENIKMLLQGKLELLGESTCETHSGQNHQHRFGCSN